MEAVKWDLNRANKITIYSGKNEITYDLFEGKWRGGGVIVGPKSMKLLIEKYEKAGCIIIPEAGAYIPTDTMRIQIGKWVITGHKNFDNNDEITPTWRFQNRDCYVKVGNTGWRDKDYSLGEHFTTAQILRYVNEAVEDNEIVRFYNENMEVIGHYE